MMGPRRSRRKHHRQQNHHTGSFESQRRASFPDLAGVYHRPPVPARVSRRFRRSGETVVSQRN
jgi:hypothetical protein